MYCFDSRIRYSETDQDSRITLSAILNYIQDCSTFQSEDLGLGLAYMKELGQAWVLSGSQVIVERYPSLGERITVGTMPYEFKGFVGYRNFFLKDAAGALFVKANTIWSLIDIETGRPVRPNEAMLEGYAPEERLSMEYAPRHIALSAERQKQEMLTVKKYQIDSNHHMNNSQYVQVALEYLTKDVLVTQVRVEYKISARLHDPIYPETAWEANRCVVCLNNEQGRPYAAVEFTVKRGTDSNGAGQA